MVADAIILAIIPIMIPATITAVMIIIEALTIIGIAIMIVIATVMTDVLTLTIMTEEDVGITIMTVTAMIIDEMQEYSRHFMVKPVVVTNNRKRFELNNSYKVSPGGDTFSWQKKTRRKQENTLTCALFLCNISDGHHKYKKMIRC